MGLKKPGTESLTPAAQAVPSEGKADSGTAAAISRLKKTEVKKDEKQYVGQDRAQEARGKTKCALFGAALMSPGLAGMPFENNVDKFLELVEKAADRGVDYTFREDK